jgi:hypothetical protein
LTRQPITASLVANLRDQFDLPPAEAKRILVRYAGNYAKAEEHVRSTRQGGSPPASALLEDVLSFGLFLQRMKHPDPDLIKQSMVEMVALMVRVIEDTSG